MGKWNVWLYSAFQASISPETVGPEQENLKVLRTNFRQFFYKNSGALIGMPAAEQSLPLGCLDSLIPLQYPLSLAWWTGMDLGLHRGSQRQCYKEAKVLGRKQFTSYCVCIINKHY